MAVIVFWTAASCLGITAAIASTLVLLCSFSIARHVIDLFDYRRITILSFWYFSFLAMIYIPAFFVSRDQAGIYVPRYMWAVESVLITVPVGAWISSIVFKYKKRELFEYFRNAVVIGPRRTPAYHLLWALLLFAILFTVLYFREVGAIPIIFMLENPGEHLALALLREDSFKLLNSPFTYLYFIVRAAIYPFVICAAFGCWRLTREKRWFWMLVIALLGGLFFASASAAKKPVAAIFLVWGLFAYLYNGGTLSRRALACVLILVMAFPFAVVYVGYKDPDLTAWDVAQALNIRMFYLPAEVVYYYFEVFPSHEGFLFGRSIDKLARLLGEKTFDAPNYVGVYGYPRDLETVTANGAFIANLNADFGMVGVILGGLLAGFIMQAVQIFLLRQRKTVFGLVAYAFAIYGFWDLNSSPLPIVLASNGVLLVLLFCYLLNRTLVPRPVLNVSVN